MVCALPGIALAQSPAPLPQPNLDIRSAGGVETTATLPDGSLVVGGNFTSFDGTPRVGLAKFKPNGTLDPAFAPTIYNGTSPVYVEAIAIDGAGDIYIGGAFTTVDGVARADIARLNPDGSLDLTWNPSSNGNVFALALGASGDLFAGGNFTTIGGAARDGLAKLSTSGSGAADMAWNPAPDTGTVASLAYDGGNHIFVGGAFANIGGGAHVAIARLSTKNSGAADASWDPGIGGVADPSVSALLLDGAGELYVGGSFATVGAKPRDGLARVSSTGRGNPDSGWNPARKWDDGAYISALLLDGAGSLYAGGTFSDPGAHPIVSAEKISVADGSIDNGWRPNPDFGVLALALTSRGHIYLGGYFSAVSGAMHFGLAKIRDNGNAAASTPQAESPGEVYAIAALPDGSMIVGGFFVEVQHTLRRNIFKMLADGSLDPAWDASADQYVQALKFDGTGSVIAGGAFTTMGGQPLPYLARIATATGAVDTTWTPNPDGIVHALAQDGDHLFAGGEFQNIGGQARGCLALLSAASGAVDGLWNPTPVQPGDRVDALALEGTTLYASGPFYYLVGSIEHDWLGKFDATGSGTPDGTWNPSPDNYVYSLAPDGSGNIYIGGFFTSVGGHALANAAKISESGSGDPDITWNPAPNNTVYSLYFDSNSAALYLGGRFTRIGGQPVAYAARVSSAGALDGTFNPAPDNYVHMIAAPGSTMPLYLGGTFATIGGQQRTAFAAFAH